jgi:hypothetical protein
VVLLTLGLLAGPCSRPLARRTQLSEFPAIAARYFPLALIWSDLREDGGGFSLGRVAGKFVAPEPGRAFLRGMKMRRIASAADSAAAFSHQLNNVNLRVANLVGHPNVKDYMARLLRPTFHLLDLSSVASSMY